MEENLNVTANTEEVVTPQIEGEQVTETEVTAEPTEQVTSEPQETTRQEDITQTQAFSKRLKEETTKAYQKAQDELIAQMYGESHGIYTKKQYDEAVKKAQEEQEIQNHIDKGIDPEIARELAEMKKFKQQYEQEIQTKQQKEKQQRDFQEFLEAYPNVNASEIPSEVWQEVEKGTPLKLAYGLHENSILKAKLAEYEKGSKTQQINATNAESSTGSVTGNGSPNDGFISYETFEANKNDRNWIMKNFKQISESRAKW